MRLLTPLLAALLAIATTTAIGAAPPKPKNAGPTIKGELQVQPHTLARLQAEGIDPRAALVWRIYPGDKVSRATSPRGLLEFTGPPGRYAVELLVITGSPEGALTVSEAATVVTIGEPKPPQPPTPPTPPTPPAPTDPLAKELAALYAADTSPTKQPDALLLAELYRQAADLAKGDKTATLAQLAERVAVAGAALLPRERLQTVRRRIAEEIRREFGEEDKPLTPELRDRAAGTFLRLRAILANLGGN